MAQVYKIRGMPKFIAFVFCVAFLIGAGGFPRLGLAFVAVVVALLFGYGAWQLGAIWLNPPTKHRH
jgi:hypothetical protein